MIFTHFGVILSSLWDFLCVCFFLFCVFDEQKHFFTVPNCRGKSLFDGNARVLQKKVHFNQLWCMHFTVESFSTESFFFLQNSTSWFGREKAIKNSTERNFDRWNLFELWAFLFALAFWHDSGLSGSEILKFQRILNSFLVECCKVESEIQIREWKSFHNKKLPAHRLYVQMSPKKYRVITFLMFQSLWGWMFEKNNHFERAWFMRFVKQSCEKCCFMLWWKQRWAAIKISVPV